jgi:hypothetical protein
MRSALLAVAVSLAIGAAAPSAPTLSVIHRFMGIDGAYPVSALIAERAGNLFGTTPSGGSGGVVYELHRRSAHSKWIETVLFEFSGEVAAGPFGPLVADRAGDLYGTTEMGGKHDQGVAFELLPPSYGGLPRME